MTPAHRSVNRDSSEDPFLMQLLDEIADQIQAGELVDLDRHIQAHPEFAERLRQLLPAMQLMANLGQSAASGETSVPPALPDAITETAILGDFRIVREVGRGGMGVVYEAEQMSLGRRVALKVLPFAATMDPRQLQRFHTEARAAAGLHHTNIVPVYGVGSERGVYYYAMQFIDGYTLADFIARQRQGPLSEVPTTDEAEARAAAASVPTVLPAAQATSATPRDTAYFRRAAEWGIEAAEALDCAHALGVVHRDVKPANLLVDTTGRLWVTDFGLAQVQSDARLTLTGDLVGTLRYMSPEQALAKRVVIDHRTDVYSLGATLYELLTLQPVFGGTDREELLRQIALEEPTAPRRLDRRIPAELEIIITKAMEKSPQDRYGTALELAADMRHFLEDRPILARRPTITQLANKWLRRHKGLARAGVVFLALTVAMLAGSTVWIWHEKGQKEAALNAEKQARLDADAARAEETRRRQQTRQALDAMTSQLFDTLLSQQKKLLPEHKEFLRQTLKYYEEFALDTGQDEAARAGVANAHLRVAAIRDKLGEVTEAEVTFCRARDLYAVLVAEFPSVDAYRLKLADCHNDLGLLFVHTGRSQEAAAAFGEAIALRKQLVAATPAVPLYRRELAKTYHNQGLMLISSSRLLEAEAALQQAVVLEEQLVAEMPTPLFLQALAGSFNLLANVLLRRSQLPAAESKYLKVLEIQERLAAEYPFFPDFRLELAQTNGNLGIVRMGLGQTRKAESHFRKGLEVMQQLVAAFPAVTEYRDTLAESHDKRGAFFHQTGNEELAELEYRQALEIKRKLAAESSTNTDYQQRLARALSNLASTLKQKGRAKEAEETYREALKIESNLAAKHPDVAEFRGDLIRLYTNLAIILDQPRRRKEAEVAAREAIKLASQLSKDFPFEPSHRKALALSLGVLGRQLLVTGRTQEAEAELGKALTIQRQLSIEYPQEPEVHNHLATIVQNLGNLRFMRKEYLQAKRLLEEGVSHADKAVEANPQNPGYRTNLWVNCVVLAQTNVELGDHAAAAAVAFHLMETPKNSMPNSHDAACFLSRCVPLAAQDKQLTEAKRKELAQTYADRAMAALRQAIKNGFRDAAHMKQNPDLNALRGREDFKKLMAELEETIKK
jgi:serine/threonine protein kinase/tetratricopeptide (TPR) repeat protein